MAPILRKYNAAATIDGVALKTRGAEDFQPNPTLDTGDVKVSLDGGALNNIATLPVVTPAGSRLVRVSLSAAELQAQRIAVLFVDQAGAEWEDTVIVIETYGHASAAPAGQGGPPTQNRGRRRPVTPRNAATPALDTP